jgi:hypothetical protein
LHGTHDELAANNRHFSFFWCPVAESRHLYCLPDVAAGIFERVAYSSEIYPIEYIPNFHELEYAIPVENGKRLCGKSAS